MFKIDDREYIIYKDNILGKGVDGIVYMGKYKMISIAVKIIENFEKEEIDELIKINKLAEKINIGPKIYDIVSRDKLIYIFMEKLDYDLNSYIKKELSNGKTIEFIKFKIKNLISPIHKKMKKYNITIGDKNMDNYMFKDGILKKIDYTQSKIKISLSYKDIKNFDYVHIYNPNTNKIEPICIF